MECLCFPGSWQVLTLQSFFFASPQRWGYSCSTQKLLEFLKEAISFLEDRDQVNGIMAVVRQGKTPSLEARKIDPKQSFIILKYLAELMVVDGKMSETEITFFVYAGGLLGFTSNILTKLWKTARAMLEATKPLAKISAGKNASLVRLTSLSESRCTFRNPRAMVPNMPVYIQISKSGVSLFVWTSSRDWETNTVFFRSSTQIVTRSQQLMIGSHRRNPR